MKRIISFFRAEKNRQYDTSIIDAEIQTVRFHSLYFGCSLLLQYILAFIFVGLFAFFAAYTILMWFTEPSLNGIY